MAYKIDPKICIQCLACIPNCPVEAISEQNGLIVIDPKKCINCGVCANICPVEAIAEEKPNNAKSKK